MKHLILSLICLLSISCQRMPCPCDDRVKDTVDSLKSIYEELKATPVATQVTSENIVHVAAIKDTHPDTDQADEPKHRPLIVDGRKVFYPTKTDKYPVFCGSRNTSCEISGSLYILRISGKTNEEYKSYLNDIMRTKLLYQ